MNNEIKEMLKKLNLKGMLSEYERQSDNYESVNMSHEERLNLMLIREVEKKNTNRVIRLLKEAKLSEPSASIASIKDIKERRLDISKIRELSTNSYIIKATNIILVGPCGCGKTYIANALATSACQSYLSVRYIRLPDLIDEFKIVEFSDDGSTKKVVEKYSKYDLLIIDEWLLYSLAKEVEIRSILEIIEARYSKKTTIICPQHKVESWYEKLGSDAKAEAIMDRLLGKNITIELDSNESLRKKVI